MIATGPTIDSQKFYTRGELEEILPPPILQVIIRQAATIDGLYFGRQIGNMLQDLFEDASRGGERSPSTTSDEKRTYLTIAQVAEILNSSPREVTRLVDAGKLRAFDLNEGMGKKKRALRVRPEWIEEMEVRMGIRPEEQPKPKFRFSSNGFSRKK